ncbi:MAG TPA: PP2C family protein-serine/threonine phosphatase [Kofleriaceae bacterium]|nr:PP2C family protein-serine/threonine phosphatase [Kofleriaceae bacterium]
MIWLILAAWTAGVAALVWAMVGRGPWLLAAAVAAAWLIGRTLLRLLDVRERPSGEALAEAITRRSEELGAGDVDAIAAATVAGIEDALPGAALELWLRGEQDEWRRARGDVLDLPPPPPELGRWLAALAGPVPREVLAAAGDAGAALAARGPGRLAMPLFYAGRLLGLLWASGPVGLEALLAWLRRPIEDALGHARLVRRVAHQTEVAEEVELAAALQQAFIPGREIHRLGRLELAGSYLPASRCGGDFWACHDLGGGRALVLVGDVTGHGIGAARITAAARGAHDVAVEVQRPGFALPGLFEALDAAVRRVGAGHYHMTCFAALVDGQRRVRYSGAGHVAPYVCRDGGGSIAIDALVGRGNPLGMGPARPPVVEIGERQLAAGDLVLFYSDGVTDCTNLAGERLGERRLQRLMRQVTAEAQAVDVARDQIEAELRQFADGAPLADDITFVVARVT